MSDLPSRRLYDAIKAAAATIGVSNRTLTYLAGPRSLTPNDSRDLCTQFAYATYTLYANARPDPFHRAGAGR
jgi:hypothetical protein